MEYRQADSVIGDSIVEQSGAFVDRRTVFGSADELRNLSHLGNPAVRLWAHRGDGALQLREEVRLTACELGAQSVRETFAFRRAQHRRAQRGEALGQPRVRELQARRVADWTVKDRDVETEICE